MKGLGRIRKGTMAATVMVAALARGGAQTIPVLRSETRVVEIDVSAKDSRGHAIGDLEQTDFTVTDARKPRAIQIFSVDRGERREASAEPPHALPPDVFSNRVASIPPPGRTTVILLDAANTYFDDYARSRQQVLDLLDKLPRDERVALYVLYRGLQILGDFTTDRESLRQAIFHYPTPSIPARPIALQLV